MSEFHPLISSECGMVHMSQELWDAVEKGTRVVDNARFTGKCEKCGNIVPPAVRSERTGGFTARICRVCWPENDDQADALAYAIMGNFDGLSNERPGTIVLPGAFYIPGGLLPRMCHGTLTAGSNRKEWREKKFGTPHIIPGEGRPRVRVKTVEECGQDMENRRANILREKYRGARRAKRYGNRRQRRWAVWALGVLDRGNCIVVPRQFQ